MNSSQKKYKKTNNTHEKMFNTLRHQGNANLNHTEIQISPHSRWLSSHQGKHQNILARMQGKRMPLYSDGGNENKKAIRPRTIWLAHFWICTQVSIQHICCRYGTIYNSQASELA